jgi:hypothetical protein
MKTSNNWWETNKDKPHPFKTYDRTEIQKVYKQHHYHCGTVLYSTDNGYTWQSVGVDSGKWDYTNWLFSFIKQ